MIGLRVVQGVFGAVMVSATAVVVRCASTESAGVAGGLQQTAMNIGPTVGVAVATTPVGATGVDMGPALTVLAAVAAVGALSALRLPGRGDAVVAVPPTRRSPTHRQRLSSPYETMRASESESRSPEENDGTPATRGRAGRGRS